MRYTLTLLVLFITFDLVDAQHKWKDPAIKPYNIDSLVAREIDNIELRVKPHGSRAFFSSLKKKLAAIKSLNGIHFTEFSYNVIKHDDFVHRTWQAQSKFNPTTKIEVFTQQCLYSKRSTDNEIKSFNVEDIRITRKQKPYVIEIRTDIDLALEWLQIDKKRYNAVYIDRSLGLNEAFDLLDRNMKANIVK
jgi:hypothetical protein